MTISEPSNTLPESWNKCKNEIFLVKTCPFTALQVFQSEYMAMIKSSFHETLCQAELEGIKDLTCVTFKFGCPLDYGKLLNFNPQYCEYFATASPQDLKEIIVETSKQLFQELVRADGHEFALDRRQISVELIIQSMPPLPQLRSDAKTFLAAAIPVMTCTDGAVASYWQVRPCILQGTVVGLSEPVFITDVQTFICTNAKCQNAGKVVRSSGLDEQKSQKEQGVDTFQATTQVFTAPTKRGAVIKCQECRREVTELFPFRSMTALRLAKLQLPDSVFELNCLLMGSSFGAIQLGRSYTFYGFPKLAFELPMALVFLQKHVQSYYAECYGYAEETALSHGSCNWKSLVREICSKMLETDHPSIDLLITLILFQVTGNRNGLVLDVSVSCSDANLIFTVLRIIDMQCPGAFSRFLHAPLGRKSETIKLPSSEHILLSYCDQFTQCDSSVIVCEEWNKRIQQAAVERHGFRKSILLLGKTADTVALDICITDAEYNVLASLSTPAHGLNFPSGAKPVGLPSTVCASLSRCYQQLAIKGQGGRKRDLECLAKLCQINAILDNRSIANGTDVCEAIELFSGAQNSHFLEPADTSAHFTDPWLPASPSASSECSFTKL